MNTHHDRSGVSARTNRAILDAAMQLLGRRPDAPLSEIASAAEVGRTTLHRYYPDRASLVDAISGEAAVRISAALQRAGLTEGDAREALLRASRELFDLGPVLSLVFGPLLSDRPEWRDTGDVEAALVEVVQRGHADDSINPALTPLWVQSLLWSMLYAADSYARDVAASRHQALAMVLCSLDGALRPPTRLSSSNGTNAKVQQ
ncbi:TetR/AcrR family transcriptional regulator [Micromonospora sp. NPDC023633]|uniref:TetR/AcrR family transcriptional regulator n=1 Tax=Micromonospora sp. NPDC023633 TaxID=3154320 RepID=UPI0033D11689